MGIMSPPMRPDAPLPPTPRCSVKGCAFPAFDGGLCVPSAGAARLCQAIRDGSDQGKRYRGDSKESPGRPRLGDDEHQAMKTYSIVKVPGRELNKPGDIGCLCLACIGLREQLHPRTPAKPLQDADIDEDCR